MRSPISIPRGRAIFRIRYLEEIWGELKRVAWPNREETWRLTVMVIVLSVIVGLILGLFDLGFAQLIDRVFLRR